MTISFRRAVMWFEFVVAGLISLPAVALLLMGFFLGDRDYHGGAYPIIFGMLLGLYALTFLVGAIALRRPTRLAWLAQVIPVLSTSWVLWDVFSH
jgi:hypothetical protein